MSQKRVLIIETENTWKCERILHQHLSIQVFDYSYLKRAKNILKSEKTHEIFELMWQKNFMEDNLRHYRLS